MTNEPQGTSCGDWKIEPRVIVDSEGFTTVTWISDGRNEMVTTAKLSELMVGIAMHLEIGHFELGEADS